MLEEPIAHPREIITHATQLLSTYFKKPVHFSKIIQLSESDRRNLILRLEIADATADMPKTVILKMTAIEKQIFEAAATAETEIETEQEQLSRFAHDWAGLEFLTQIGGNHGPKFLAGNFEYKFILIEDLGAAHPSLVGPLTREPSSENLHKAETALESYVQRLGKIHADTAGKYDIYSLILKRIYPEALRFHSFSAEKILAIIKKFTASSKCNLNELYKEIEDVGSFSKLPSDFLVLLHGDTCPDNVYYQENEMKFIDFEFADFGNALIDGVYLRMCMPSCWCSKAIPSTLVNKLESIYRAELKKEIISANDDETYNKQLIYSCAYWVIRSLETIDKLGLVENEWICPSGPVDAESKWEPDKNAFRPRILSRLEAFISCAKEAGYLPHLKKFSIELLLYLRYIWPETQNIDLYPVFK